MTGPASELRELVEPSDQAVEFEFLLISSFA